MEIIEYTMHMHTARWMLPTSWVWKSALKHCFTNTKPSTQNRQQKWNTATLPHICLLGIPAAVCLDRMGAAAIANCREKLGWPDTLPYLPYRNVWSTVCLCWDTSIYSIYSCVFSDEHQDLRSYQQIIFTAFSRNVWNRRNCLHPKDRYLERSTWRLQYLLFDCLASWCSKEARTHAVLQQNIFDKNLLF